MVLDFYTGGQNSSAQVNPNLPWWVGGNVQGPPGPQNPVRQALGNFVESIGNAIPGMPEGYLSEKIAGGPTARTTVRASDTGPGGSYPPSQTQTTQTTQQNKNPGSGLSGDALRAQMLQQDPGRNPVDDGWLQQYLSAQNQSNSGYDQYLSQLDSQINDLGGQRSDQENIANNTFQQGMNTLGSQLAQGQQDISTNREKTLRDLSNNLKQSFQSGNTYLGARGASDSSAADQYSYALSKLGSQQRGDVQSQYDQNLFKLKNTYDTETKNLELSKNSQLSQISQWFAEAQNQLRGQKGQVALQKSQQALNIAMQMAQQVQQQASSQRAALDQWAANHATSFQQLQQQLAQNGRFQASIPNDQTIQSSNTRSVNPVSYGYGGLFGNTKDKTQQLFA